MYAIAASKFKLHLFLLNWIAHHNIETQTQESWTEIPLHFLRAIFMELRVIKFTWTQGLAIARK